tara:strand:- start:365 stop:541 length:177 start_codon:yes stop_codon:yes gene_type:complete
MELNFKLSVEEVNAILNALGQRPYAEVQSLIAKIKADGEAQIEAAKVSQQTEPTPVSE